MPRRAAKALETGLLKKPRARSLKGEEAEANHIVETQNGRRRRRGNCAALRKRLAQDWGGSQNAKGEQLGSKAVSRGQLGKIIG